jgi:DNA mismatch repair ATPase MutS
MEVDKTTINDLSIFDNNDELSIFEQLDRTLTANGRERLRRNFQQPLRTKEEILGTQLSLKKIISKLDAWPGAISNGSIMVIEKMYDSQIDQIPANPGSWGLFSYKLLHGPDYSLLKYSVGHAFDFLKAMMKIIELLDEKDTPEPLRSTLEEAKKMLNAGQWDWIRKIEKASLLKGEQVLKLGHTLLYRFRQQMHSLLQLHARIDAWYSMAKITKEKNLCFAEFREAGEPFLDLEGLYHLLVENAVPYDIHINRQKNFLFLTGANMAGKSTFIKSVGVAAFLAHTGMGVPAKKMQLSVFDGLLSNINVIDNIVKGESYFFNEVQRIKKTITKINDGRKWLILIDELFKGTNVQDAMKCSTTVIEGLLKISNSLFILSTHLYEIAEDLNKHPNIIFRYFETSLKNEELDFNYRLHEGVSNDRMGYLILKQQGVVNLIENL